MQRKKLVTDFAHIEEAFAWVNGVLSDSDTKTPATRILVTGSGLGHRRHHPPQIVKVAVTSNCADCGLPVRYAADSSRFPQPGSHSKCLENRPIVARYIAAYRAVAEQLAQQRTTRQMSMAERVLLIAYDTSMWPASVAVPSRSDLIASMARTGDINWRRRVPDQPSWMFQQSLICACNDSRAVVYLDGPGLNQIRLAEFRSDGTALRMRREPDCYPSDVKYRTFLTMEAL